MEPQPKREKPVLRCHLHHRDAEFAEIGEFLNQELSSPRPPRIRGEFSSGSIDTIRIALKRSPRNVDQTFTIEILTVRPEPRFDEAVSAIGRALDY